MGSGSPSVMFLSSTLEDPNWGARAPGLMARRLLSREHPGASLGTSLLRKGFFMSRTLLIALTCLFAALTTSASAQVEEIPMPMEGKYKSTNLDGSPIYGHITIYVEITYSHTEFGEDIYTTDAYGIDNVTGERVDDSSGYGTLIMPIFGPGTLISGSNGSSGTLTDNGAGGWVASYPTGNTRLWTKQ